jgi:hypothetical protein
LQRANTTAVACFVAPATAPFSASFDICAQQGGVRLTNEEAG